MKPIRDEFFIKIEKEREDSVKFNDTELYIDTSYDAMRYARQYGVVVETPHYLTDGRGNRKENIDVEVGDTVYCHHFLVEENNKINLKGVENTYKLPYNMIYARKRGEELKMLVDWNFVEPFMEGDDEVETDSGILISSNKKEVKNRGRLVHINEEMKSYGAKEGDVVVFTKNSDYKMKVEGEELMRMKNIDIMCVLENVEG